MATYKRGNNGGKGFFYAMADGATGWVYGLSKQEWDCMVAKHGAFIKYIKA